MSGGNVAARWRAAILADDRVAKTLLAVAFTAAERCDYATGENVAKSPATIAQEVGLAKRDHAAGYLRQLEALGYLEDTGRRGRGGQIIRRLVFPDYVPPAQPTHLDRSTPTPPTGYPTHGGYPTSGGSPTPYMGEADTPYMGDNNKNTNSRPPYAGETTRGDVPPV